MVCSFASYLEKDGKGRWIHHALSHHPYSTPSTLFSMAPLSWPVADSWWSLMSTVPTPGWSTVRRKCSTAKASDFKRSHSCSICSSKIVRRMMQLKWSYQAECLCRLPSVGDRWDRKQGGDFFRSQSSLEPDCYRQTHHTHHDDDPMTTIMTATMMTLMMMMMMMMTMMFGQ